MQHIRHVIGSTLTPSWLGSVPSNFGDAGAGHLKADEWGILATVYLPLALISLWGEGTGADIRRRNILNHTMELFCATRLVFLRTMSKSRMEAYRTCIINYIRDLTIVHPDALHKGSGHMAIHIYDFLEIFGPTRGWWTFPFERVIGILQRIPNNNKVGGYSAIYFSIFSFLINFSRGDGIDNAAHFYTEK